MQDPTIVAKTNPLDNGIKVLTMFKLLLQIAFYGLLLGGTIWFLIKNPLPELIKGMQQQVIDSFSSDDGR